MTFWVVPQNWYWSVQDSSPSTMVWKSSVGSLVVFADADYVAFLAAGNVATTIDTMANLLVVIDTFNQSLVRPGYISIAISGGNYTFTSPLNALIPKTINVSAIDMAGRAIILPQENLCGSIAIGDTTLITNNDATNSVDILLNDGTTKIATIPSLGAAYIIPTGNAGTNGTWEVFYLPSIPLIAPITVAQGGTGQVTLTAHGVLVGEGTAQVGHVTPGGAGTLLIGQAGADPVFNAMSGDATITNAGVVTVKSVTALFNMPVYTVTTLPSAGRVTGSVALVSDATSNILIGAGGGTAYALVAWNGAAWVAV